MSAHPVSFQPMPPQPPLNAGSDAYGAECLARGERALSQVNATLDLPYGPDYWQKVDVYGPKADGDTDTYRDLPVLLFFHGGGWTHGYKEWCAFMAPVFVDLPCILVSASYRLLPEADFPAPFDDAYLALRWVHDNIERFGGSKDRIFVGGHSAGGQLASTLAVREDKRVEAGLPADGIKGCFCISTTFNRRVVNALIAPNHVTEEDPDGNSPACSLFYAHQSKVPFLISWGGNEKPWYEIFGRKMVETLREGGCPVQAHRFPLSNHFDIHLDTGHENSVWTRAVRHFMKHGQFNSEFENER